MIPRPLSAHPGNVFMAGEDVVISSPAGTIGEWRANDFDGKAVRKGRWKEAKAHLGRLPVGYYEVITGPDYWTNHITLAVLEPLKAPTPLDSPISLDVALAWCFPQEQMSDAASLCALAGMNRVRDRLLWAEMEPKPNEMAPSNRYDFALNVQANAGLQVLQVNHTSAPWANKDGRRFPEDLRDIYHFYELLARRWKGKIEAFEPWNEADLSIFGGHTGDEMASLQKAAYWGLKAGNPDLKVCQNVFGLHRHTTLRNFAENNAWPYFEIFNLHHYEPLSRYPETYADFREVSAGKPMWVSECNMTVKWVGDPNLKEPDRAGLIEQSKRVAKIYSESLYEGVQAVFFFMLPHYTERDEQYGLLHADLTPRPSYLTAAAVGRILAGARSLGSAHTDNKSIHGYLFSTMTDGKASRVLVAWSDEPAELKLPRAPEAMFDHLGRPLAHKKSRLALDTSPLFVLLAQDGLPPLDPPPAPAKLLTGSPSTVVLQAVLPEKQIRLINSAYEIPANAKSTVPVFLYNFGSGAASGKLSVTVPKGWTAQLPREISIAPGERKEVALELESPNPWGTAARVRIDADFGPAGSSVLGLRFLPPKE